MSSPEPAWDLVAIAESVGSRPYLFLSLMVAAGALAVLALVFAVRWSDAHARAIWGRAKGAWSRLAMRPAMRAIEARVPWVWRAMRSLSATEYLLLHLTIGFVGAFAGLLFLRLGQSVSEEQTMVAVDLALAQALHRAATPEGVTVLSFFTDFGGGIAMPLLGFGVSILLAWKRKRLLLVGWIVALAGAGILNTALKAFFARARPFFEKPYSVGAGWSFPSGHSMTTLVAAGMLAYMALIFVKSPAIRLLLVLLALSWTVAMGFSRMYLGVHYLSDVVAGFAAGTVWLGACVTGIEIARRRPRGAATVAEVRAP